MHPESKQRTRHSLYWFICDNELATLRPHQNVLNQPSTVSHLVTQRLSLSHSPSSPASLSLLPLPFRCLPYIRRLLSLCLFLFLSFQAVVIQCATLPVGVSFLHPPSHCNYRPRNSKPWSSGAQHFQWVTFNRPPARCSYRPRNPKPLSAVAADTAPDCAPPFPKSRAFTDSLSIRMPVASPPSQK